MTHDELQAIKATLADLRKQMPLGSNDSETAVDCADQLVAEVERLREALQITRGALADVAHMKPKEIAAGVAQRKAPRIYNETKHVDDM